MKRAIQQSRSLLIASININITRPTHEYETMSKLNTWFDKPHQSSTSLLWLDNEYDLSICSTTFIIVRRQSQDWLTTSQRSKITVQ